jgi:hypothetical protein
MESDSHIALRVDEPQGISYLYGSPTEVGRVFQSFLPAAVIQKYTILDLIQMASFGRNQAAEAAIVFSVPGFGDHIIALDKLPFRLVCAIADCAPDTNRVFHDWLGSGNVVPGSALHNKADVAQSHESGIFPLDKVGYLRRICILTLNNGKRAVDYPIFFSICRSHKVLHCLRDTYTLSGIRHIEHHPESPCGHETENRDNRDAISLLSPMFDLFAPFRGQTVVTIIQDGARHDTLYGYIEPQATPSRYFEMGDLKKTYNQILFMALPSEVDAMNVRERYALD